MESRLPGTLGAASCCVSQHGVELGFGDGEPVRCQAPWSASDWWTWCSPDVVDGVATRLALDTSGANEVWKLGEKGFDRRTATDDFHAGGLRTGSLGRADNDVIPSSRRLFLQSTKRPKWERKSAPMRGSVTSATKNRHVNPGVIPS
jgi:hypothetical protein